MILITGASGFLGGFIVEEFLKAGYQVRATARPQSDLKYLKKTKAQIFFADITDLSQVKKALGGVDEVIHAAAILGGGRKKRELFLKVNYEATKNLADLCIAKSIKRLTFISSISAVGPTASSEQKLKEDTPTQPDSFYGESKLLAENYLLSLCEQKKLEVVIVRPALIYGPRDKRCAVNYFRIANLKFFPLPLPADKKVSLIYVADAARGVFLAHTQSAPCETYMLSHEVVTIKEFAKKLFLAKKTKGLLIPISASLLKIIISALGSLPGITGQKSQRKKFKLGSWAVDSSKMKEKLNFYPQVKLIDGFKKTWDFYSHNKNLLSLKYLLRNF